LPALWQVYLAILLITAAEGGMNTIYPPFLYAARYSVEQIGFFFALFGVLQLAARLPAGALYAAGRAKILFAGFVALFVFSTVGFAFASDSAPILILTMLHGFAFGGIGTVMLAWAIELKPAHQSHGSAMGWYTASLSAGYSLGNFSGGWLADNFGYALAFAGIGLAPALSLLLSLTLPNPQPSAQAEPKSARAPSWRERAASARAVITPNLMLATLIAFYLNFLDDGFSTFFPIFGLSAGLTLTFIGLLKSVKSLTATILRAGAGAIFNVVNFKWLNNTLIVVWALAVFLVPLIREAWVFVILFIVIGVCRALTRVTSATMIAEEKANDRRGIGLASGIYNAGLDVGTFAGPLVSGLIASATDIPTMFRVIPIGLLAIYFAAVVWVQRARVPKPAAA